MEIRQVLDVLTSYPNEFWKYPVVVYYLVHKHSANFEIKFLGFLRKLTVVLLTRYLVTPTINAVKADIMKLNTAITDSPHPVFEFKEVDFQSLDTFIRTPHRNAVRMLLKLIAYNDQKTLLPLQWEIEHILPQKWQTNYFMDIGEEAIREKVEHIGNKLPFEKKLNIVAGNGYFQKKKNLYSKSCISITKSLGNSGYTDWNLDSISERDLRVSDLIIKILVQWNQDYSLNTEEYNGPSPDELAMIEKFKANGWV